MSYRRHDCGFAAARLADKFKRHFDLFWDIEGIRPGRHFPREIQKAVEGSDRVLVLIGTQWAAERDEFNRRRIEDPSDLVAHEIAAGLRRDVVMPVLIDDAHMPERSELPSHIAALSDLNAVTVRLATFDDDAVRLRRAIWGSIAPPPWPVWRKAVISLVLVAAAVVGIAIAINNRPEIDPSVLRVGQSGTFEYQRVTVSDVRFDAAYGHVVKAEVCVLKLATSAPKAKLSWAAWWVEDSSGKTYQPMWLDASTPSGIHPETGRYAVGECARGLIPFNQVAEDTKITKVLYRGKEDQASWKP